MRRHAAEPGRLAFWRSPEGQPSWARPALLALTVVAGFAYAWNATGNLEVYYAAAVRSMSMSWHDFLFAAFDPAGTVTVDKLPGAFWLQALSVRLFGVHAWAIVAPQVLEGMASVLVLYRIVRRLSGPLAGVIAATVFVLSPATVALNRGNVPDTLMVLLLLLAADRTVSAALDGRLRSLVWAGVFVGLAFQAKMIEAWLVLPALALVYWVGSSGRWSRRAARLALAGAAAAAVSLVWMLFVAVFPASQRPYVDGSHTNSIFSQVFVYNGFGRLDQASPNQLLSKAIGLQLGSPAPGWDRLLSGAAGRDTAWLIPAALIALGCCVALSRRRVSALRTGCALWGTWLVVFLIVFSVSTTINSYYTAALTPPVAGLLGMGLALAWERRADARARWAVAAAVAVSCAYAAWLLPAGGFGTVAGLRWVVIVLGAGAVLALVVGASGTGRRRAVAVWLAAIAALAVPAAASASVVGNALGPFDTPFESPAAWNVARTLGALASRTRGLLAPLERAKGTQPDLMATQTSAVAAAFIYDSGEEVVPIGGFTGTIPEPSLSRLQAMIAGGDFRLVIQAQAVTDPRLVWVARNCFPVPPASNAATGSLRFAVYYCGRLPLL
jgi:4-amino-4-deoxy-L-arabinose transferase-like glycosyltransferase